MLSLRPREDRFEASGAKTEADEQADAAEDSAEEDQASAEVKTQELTPADRRVVAELQLRDREVRAHEAAHKAAGGAHVGGASYTYQYGPDGRQYAIGGEVPVDLSTSGGSPEAVIAKMEQVRAAALAPADPSAQDYAVAAAADAIAAQARHDLRAAEKEELQQHEEAAEPAKTEAVAQEGDADVPSASAVLGAAPSREADGRANGRANGRAMQAYRQAQESQFAQALINQRA